MLKRQDTLIFTPDSFTVCRKPLLVEKARHPICPPFPPPIRTPSPGEMSSSSSGAEEDGNMFDPIAAVPELSLTTSTKHYEFWDPGPQDMFFLGGVLNLAADHILMGSGTHLEFSHFELELKTHGRQGRFSRENIWSPSYIDYASTPIHRPAAQHLARTRVKTFITFSQRRDGYGVEVAYKIGLPQELFYVMRTRHIRLTARAIFLGWERGGVVSTEVVEADPITVSVSHLRMRDCMLSG